jgi:4-hydroxy-tetrahydrodipicolinate synthase
MLTRRRAGGIRKAPGPSSVPGATEALHLAPSRIIVTEHEPASSSPGRTGAAVLWVPVPAPFDAADRLDGASIDRMVDQLAGAGVHGLWINGTTGEFHALDDEERAEVVAYAASRSAGRMKVAAHIGDTSLRRVIAHGRRALDAGADELACMPPYYLAHSQPELVTFFSKVADALGRPLYLYDFPAYCKVALQPETIAKLATSGVAVGIKESGPSVDRFRKIVKAVRDVAPDFLCMHGASALFVTNLSAGADGGVCAGMNVCPGAYVRAFDAVDRGSWTEARAEQKRISDVWDGLTAALSARPQLTAPSVLAIKFWLARQGVFQSDRARAPLSPLTAEERARLEDVAARYSRDGTKGTGSAGAGVTGR